MTTTDAGLMYRKLPVRFHFHLVEIHNDGYASLVRSSDHLVVLRDEISRYNDPRNLAILNNNGKKL